MTVQLTPTLTRCWGLRGTQRGVPAWPGGHQRLHLAGAVEARSGRFWSRFLPNINGTAFRRFLSQLARRYRRGWVILVVDNAGWHKSRPVRAWLAAHPRWGLFFLPRYSPQWNPPEWAWKRLRQEVTHNAYFGARPALRTALAQALRRLGRDHRWGRGLVRQVLHLVKVNVH